MNLGLTRARFSHLASVGARVVPTRSAPPATAVLRCSNASSLATRCGLGQSALRQPRRFVYAQHVLTGHAAAGHRPALRWKCRYIFSVNALTTDEGEWRRPFRARLPVLTVQRVAAGRRDEFSRTGFDPLDVFRSYPQKGQWAILKSPKVSGTPSGCRAWRALFRGCR